MPQIKQPGTDNILANWQGFVSVGGGSLPPAGTLVTRAAFQCTLTRLTGGGSFKLSLLPTFMDDENMLISVSVQDGSLPKELITYNTDGTATISFINSGDSYDPGLFNIVVYQCTDFVSIIEGPPGNP